MRARDGAFVVVWGESRGEGEGRRRGGPGGQRGGGDARYNTSRTSGSRRLSLSIASFRFGRRLLFFIPPELFSSSSSCLFPFFGLLSIFLHVVFLASRFPVPPHPPSNSFLPPAFFLLLLSLFFRLSPLSPPFSRTGCAAHQGLAGSWWCWSWCRATGVQSLGWGARARGGAAGYWHA
ncbi:hypothetical protein B0H11DRAFT_1995047 [Mycena galericulata]|nr:hypothetical protein B0H11DRAFT_1995047 [Mycena galericulata]